MFYVPTDLSLFFFPGGSDGGPLLSFLLCLLKGLGRPGDRGLRANSGGAGRIKTTTRIQRKVRCWPDENHNHDRHLDTGARK